MAFRILKIDQLRIAVPGAEAAASAFEALGFSVEATHVVPTEKGQDGVPARGRIAPRVLEPTDPSSVIAKFLKSRKGLHHVCVLVDDIEAAITELKARGVELLDDKPRIGAGGRVAFVHPRSAAGVLLELKEDRR